MDYSNHIHSEISPIVSPSRTVMELRTLYEMVSATSV